MRIVIDTNVVASAMFFGGKPKELLEMLMRHSEIAVCRDPDDDKFIECAVDAQCVYIVSGDKDLLAVEEYEGIKIVTVTDFLDGNW